MKWLNLPDDLGPDLGKIGCIYIIVHRYRYVDREIHIYIHTQISHSYLFKYIYQHVYVCIYM